MAVSYHIFGLRYATYELENNIETLQIIVFICECSLNNASAKSLDISATVKILEHIHVGVWKN